MRNLIFVLIITGVLISYTIKDRAQHTSSQGGYSYYFTRKLSSLLFSWTSASPSRGSPQSDGNAMRYEDGYLVETVVQGNEIGVVPYMIRVSDDGEIYAVDEANSNIVKITPPLSQYSRARLVAGSFQGLLGHIDGKPSDARFNRPKGVTMDDKGNLYVADTLNLAIRKIGDSGVTTIAGGKSGMSGYRDGPSEDAKFSSDFDVVYVRPTCSLLVIDRGNAALRKISLNQEDCDYQNISVSCTDLLMVIGVVAVGYVVCILQQGYGSTFFSRRMEQLWRPASDTLLKDYQRDKKPTPVVDNSKEFPGWPSFGQLMVDLSKLTMEALARILLYFVPSRLRSLGSRKGLTPLKDTLLMPEDVATGRNLSRRQRTPTPLSETRQAHSQLEKHSDVKPPKIKSASFKDPPVASKQRSSKRPEFTDFYSTTDVPFHIKSKRHKERIPREKSGETVYGVVGTEQKQVAKPVYDYAGKQKPEHYIPRTKFSSNESFRF